MHRQMLSKLFEMWLIIASIDAMGDDSRPPYVVF